MDKLATDRPFVAEARPGSAVSQAPEKSSESPKSAMQKGGGLDLAAWAARRFTPTTLSPQATRDEVIADLGRLAHPVEKLGAIEAKKRKPYLEALANLLSTPDVRISVESLQSDLRDWSPFHLNRPSARVIPAVLTQGERFKSYTQGARYDVRFATPFKVQGLRVAMSLGEITFERGTVVSPKRQIVAQPLFEMPPELFERVQASAPEIISGLEKLATYASHDLLHHLFDEQWSTIANIEHEAQIDHGVKTVGFHPNVYEAFLFAMMRKTFDEVCRLYPRFEDVVMNDAEAYVAAVERYRGARSAEVEEHELKDVDAECAFLLIVGLGKNLMFVVNPGDPEGTQTLTTVRERRMRALFECYPFLWKATTLQRTTHAPVMRWTGGPQAGELVDIVNLARVKFTAASHNKFKASDRLAREMFGKDSAEVRALVRSKADIGDGDALYAMAQFAMANGDKGEHDVWNERAIDAGHEEAIKKTLEKLDIKQPTDRATIERLALRGSTRAAAMVAKEHDSKPGEESLAIRWWELAHAAKPDAYEKSKLATALFWRGDEADVTRAIALFKEAADAKDYDGERFVKQHDHMVRARDGDADARKLFLDSTWLWEPQDRWLLAQLSHLDDPRIWEQYGRALMHGHQLEAAQRWTLKAQRAGRDVEETLRALMHQGTPWQGTEAERIELEAKEAAKNEAARADIAKRRDEVDQEIVAGRLDKAYEIAIIGSYQSERELLPAVIAAGSLEAIYRMAGHYHRGLGGEKNLASAIALYTRGADAGHVGCATDLYEHYLDVDDEANTLVWMRRAAELGGEVAMSRVHRRERAERVDATL